MGRWIPDHAMRVPRTLSGMTHYAASAASFSAFLVASSMVPTM